MALYKVSGQSLTPIRGTEFKLERDLQRLLEANLEPIFGLEFIATEFSFNNMRLDTVAYDPESKCFVVIEYKRDKGSSVVDQGYAYLSIVLNNQAEFVLAYNKKTGLSLDKKDFDWSATRVIFVASRFTPHQLEAINFKDLPFELWEVQPYDNDLLKIEQRLATKQIVSIKSITRSITGSATSQNIVEKEIKTYTISDLFPEKSGLQRAIFDELDEGIRAIDDSINVSPKKYYIGYRIGSDWRIFVTLSSVKNGVRVTLNRTQLKDISDPEHAVTYDEKSLKNYNQHMSTMFIHDSSDVDYALSIVRQIYKRHLKEFGK